MEREDPLLNPIIVSNILDHVSTLQDINSCRLVCSLWNELGFKQWRSLVTLNLYNTSIDNEWSVEDFLRHLNDPEDPHQLIGKPFKRFIFNDINLCEHPLLQIVEDENSDNFWNKVGPIITYVQLKKCTFPGERPELFEKIVAEKLPSLKTLVLVDNKTTNNAIRHRQYDGLWDPDRRVRKLMKNSLKLYQSTMKRNSSLENIQISGVTPMNFTILLLNSPNLQNLTVGRHPINDPGCGYEYRQLSLACQLKLRLDNEPFQFKHLDFMNLELFFWRGLDLTDDYEMDHIEFPLKYLAVELPSDGVNDCLTQLCNYFPTLEELHVFRTPHHFTRLYESPFEQLENPMDSIRELYLYGNVIKDLICIEDLPSLKVLVVDPKCHGNLEKLECLAYHGMVKPNSGNEMINPENRGEMIMEEMERFHLNTETFLGNDIAQITARVETLVAWMPFLIKLETNLNISGFWAVCRLLPELEELVLLFDSKIGDEAVTGLTSDETDPNRNNITSFTKLRKFELRTRCDESNLSDENRLGDKSVYEGFLKLSTLQCVIISASRKMTESAMECLKSHVPQVEFIRNYDVNQPHGTGKCCRIKLVERELKI